MNNQSEPTPADTLATRNAMFADEEPDWLELKLALNEAIWTKAPGTTTLAQAEEAACRAIGYLNECFQANSTQPKVGAD